MNEKENNMKVYELQRWGYEFHSTYKNVTERWLFTTKEKAETFRLGLIEEHRKESFSSPKSIWNLVGDLQIEELEVL